MGKQSKGDEDRWYGIVRKFSSRQAAEEWMLLVHGIENPVLIDLPMANAAVARYETAAAAAALPALAGLPAAAPSSPHPAYLGQMLQLLQQDPGDPRTIQAISQLVAARAVTSTGRSNTSLTGGSGTLPAPSSSPDDPVFSPGDLRTGRKSAVIDWASDEDEKPSSSRHKPTAVPPSSSAASSSTTSTTIEPRIRTARLAKSPSQDRSAKRARRMSDDITMVPQYADMSDRFVNFQPALMRLNEIFKRGNAVIITEDIIAAPGDDGSRSDTIVKLDLSEVYTKPTAKQKDCEEMNQSTSKNKCKGRAQTNVIHEPWFSKGIPQRVHLGRNVAEGIDDGNNSDNSEISEEGDSGGDKDDGGEPNDGDNGDDCESFRGG
ncbi:hypothetical protein F52700_5980 [Fusarium sp. NRRL 52700]|nr:hypothetical protein F52700_5980 [Fusarium sp. NRRL 52700]